MRCLLTLLACMVVASVGHAQAISGPARVLDGDTLEVAGQRIRLHGIDAPEGKQQCRSAAGDLWACGQEAAAHLQRLAGGQVVACEVRGTGKYGRPIAVCTAGAVDLNRAMVDAGLALAYRQYSSQYVEAEEAARAARRGMWAGPFVEPWDWRRGFRLAGEGEEQSSPTTAPPIVHKPSAQRPAPAQTRKAPQATDREHCRIKGNISSSGRIYHVPGSRYYGRTRIDEAAGERWFCTEDEARAAGWRAAR